MLDADDEPLKNKYGEKMERDIVQFVPLKKYSQTNFSLVSGQDKVGHGKVGVVVFRPRRLWQRFQISFSPS